jgi:SAM-dependent methyltransferase
MCSNHVTDSGWSHGWLQWQVSQPLSLKHRGSTHLDLGSGSRPANPFKADKLIASDIQPISKQEYDSFRFIQIEDISKIPLPNESLDSISAFDLLEHIPRDWPRNDGGIRHPFIELMNEISRVLKPGGVFLAVTPAYPSAAAFQDPTHVNIISKETIHYFDEKAWARELGYGYQGNLDLVHQSWLRGAGPYLGRLDKNAGIVKEDSFIGYKLKLRIINRTIRLITFQRPMSLLWVMRKPCSR